MQIKNNQLNNLQNPWIIGLVKLLLLVGCLVFIAQKFHHQSISLIEIETPDGFGFALVVVFLLMFVNWYLEVLRWKISVEVFEPLSIKNAWKVILGGLALNWVMPFTTGDLVARLSIFKDKYQASSATVLNRGIMIFYTLIIGFYGMSFVADEVGMNNWFGIIAILACLTFMSFFKKGIKRFLVYFQEVSAKTLIQITTISLFRYLVFVFQFYLLLATFMPWIEWQVLIAGIGWIFIIRSSLPLFFGGVGVREASGIVFFNPYVMDVEFVIIPIFLIWIINTVIPSIAGLLLIMNAKPSSNSSK